MRNFKNEGHGEVIMKKKLFFILNILIVCTGLRAVEWGTIAKASVPLIGVGVWSVFQERSFRRSEKAWATRCDRGGNYLLGKCDFDPEQQRNGFCWNVKIGDARLVFNLKDLIIPVIEQHGFSYKEDSQDERKNCCDVSVFTHQTMEQLASSVQVQGKRNSYSILLLNPIALQTLMMFEDEDQAKRARVQMQAVIGHEFTHLKHGDSLKAKHIDLGLNCLWGALCSCSILKNNSPLEVLAPAALAATGIWMVSNYMSCKREERCDKLASSDPHVLRELGKYFKALSHHENNKQDDGSVIIQNSMFEAAQDTDNYEFPQRSFLENLKTRARYLRRRLTCSHPDTMERCEYLTTYAQELEEAQ